MDKNTIIGFVLIGLLIIGWSIFNMPSKEELARQKKSQDSIALVTKQKEIEAKQAAGSVIADSTQVKANTTEVKKTEGVSTDLFRDTTNTTEQFLTLENDVMKVTLSNKGGRVYSVELKKYTTWDKKPLILFDGDESSFNYFFFAGNNTQVNTGDVFFKPLNESVTVTGKDSSTIRLRAYLTPTRYIEQAYTIKGGSYLVGYHFSIVGLDSVIQNNVQYINLVWNSSLNNADKDISSRGNSASSTVYYKNKGEDASYLSTTADDEKKLPGKIDWVCFKEHFFNSTLISSSSFDEGNVKIKLPPPSETLKNMSAELILPYNHEPNKDYAMQFYFGPNKYNDLKKLGNGMEEIIPLGYSIFAWISTPVNKYFIIPLFNFFSGFISNWGIIILIMTVFIKIILMPLTYRSLLSAAKMKVIKPEIDDLKEKYKDDQSKFGQEQLKLFQKAGVNPLGGCLPILLQLPILVAMYSFFPSSIELRQQSFLWAKDLSIYDSIYDFPNHFSLPFYGDHISLFTLLMTVTQLLTAMYNNQLNSVTGQMKWMQYIFPFMLLGVFNNMSAALTYYYFLSNVLTFGLQFVAQNYFLDHAKIHAQIQERKKSPAKKKSGFMARLEEMQKKQQQQNRNKK